MRAANFIGVYSDYPPGKRGKGGYLHKRYWFVWDNLNNGFIIQLLDGAYIPTAEPEYISKEDFRKRFKLEPTIYATPISKIAVSEGQKGTKADLQTLKEFELAEAEKTDKRLRDEFSIAIARLKRGDKTLALKTLERLADRREGIVPAHKHAFTDFAIDLRKNKMPSIAFRFYQRALELSPEDSNAWFNMARIMFDLGDYEGTEKHLLKALSYDEDFEYAKRFLEFVDRYRKDSLNAGDDNFEPLELRNK